MPEFLRHFKKYSNAIAMFTMIVITVILANAFPSFKETVYVPQTDLSASFIRSTASASLSVSAESAALIECTSGELIYSKNADKQMPMASTTKIMTALVVIEKCELSDIVTIPKAACGIEGSSIYLREGEQFSVKELLYALMLASANDSATALALHTSGSIEDFADEMNRKAKELGLQNTHFTNPHGLHDDEHYTTARELAIIARCASQNDVFREITSTNKTIIRRDSKESARLLTNHNKLLRLYDGAFGIKTGFTKTSGRCLVSGAERNGLSFIAVTLNAPDDWNDHISMLDLGFSLYENVKLAGSEEISCSLPISGSYQSSVLCTNTDAVYAVLPKDRSGKISYRIEMRRFEFAPIDAGTFVGRVVFLYNGEEICAVPLTTKYSAAKE